MTIELQLTNKCNLNCKQCYTKKDGMTMNDELLDKVITYINCQMNLWSSEEFEIQLAGGELGILGSEYLLNVQNKLIEKLIRKPKFLFRTNLLYNIDDKFMQFIKNCDLIGTSYDYKTRFVTKEQEDLWKFNIDKLHKEGIELDCIITINKYLINEKSPEDIINFLLGLNITKFDLHRLYYPLDMSEEDMKKYDEEIRPKNRVTDKWLLQFFKVYEKLRKQYDLFCETIEVIRQSLDGNVGEYTHCRSCQIDCRTIRANGDLCQCTNTVNEPFGNILNGTVNYDIFDKHIKFEKTLSEECQKCKFLKYCLGDCCFFPYDETGCPGCKMIYEYLWMRKQMMI